MDERYEITIDELVLYGFSPGDRSILADAIGLELTRLVETTGLPAHGVPQHRIDAGRIELPHGSTPQAVGIAVAAAIHRGLGAAR